MLSLSKMYKFNHSYPEIITHETIDDWIKKWICHGKPVAEKEKAIVKIDSNLSIGIKDVDFEPVKYVKQLQWKPTECKKYHNNS